MLFSLLLSCFNSVEAQEVKDQTLSPYFYIPAQDCPPEAFPLLHTEAQANIAGVIADVAVTQVYKNNGSQAIEAIYVFPASTRAAVYHMEFQIGERTIVAKIEEKAKARQDYEQAKKEGKRATLLEQHRPNVFQMNVANIMPGDRVEVRMKYTEMLVPEEGTYEFVYPTVVGPRYAGETANDLLASNDWVANPYLTAGEKTPYTFDFGLCLKAGLPIQQMQSTTHKVKINYSDQSVAQLVLDPIEKDGGNRDFVLQYRLRGKEIEKGMLVYEGEKENYFMMMVQPPERVQVDEIAPREYIFIVDISGSMNGFPLETSKSLLKDLIGQLRPTDRFNVMLFAGSAAFLSEGSIAANSGNINKAVQFIRRQRGGGGTNLLNAIHRAMAVPKMDGFSRSFVIATDGYVNVETAAFDYIRDHLNEANFFSFGIGRSVNRHLIEGMARVGVGEPFIVLDGKDAPAQAGKFRRYIESPLLTNIQLSFNQQDVYDVSPAKIPDLMGERPIVVYGKYRKNGSGKITLSGQTPSGKFSKTLSINKATKTNESKALSNLWARHRIQQLNNYTVLRDCAKDVLAQKITAVGLKHNLLTAYTSFVAIDSEIANANGASTTVKQPLPLPAGVPNSAVSGNLQQLSTTSAPPRKIYKKELEVMNNKTEAYKRKRTYKDAPPPPPPAPMIEDVPEEEVEEIFMVVEEFPMFPGCEAIAKNERKGCADEKMLAFIKENLKFPKHMVNSNIQGRVYLQFVVDKTGAIINIKVVRSLHPDLDREAIRVVSIMPKWIPGKQRGRLVNVTYTLPIKFDYNN